MLLKNWQRFILTICLCGMMHIFGAAHAAGLQIAYPANGLYSLQPKCAPNKELTVQDASTADGANVFLWSINSNWHTQPSHQKWRITRLGNSEWYKIEAENSGKALNVHNGIAQNGTNVSIWPYGGNMHQFRFFDAGNGYYVIQSNIGGTFVLDVSNGTNSDGANVQVWTWNGTNAQKWKLVSRNGQSNTQTATTSTNTRVNPSTSLVGKTATAKCRAPAYQYSNLQTQIGSVFAGDSCKIMRESGNAYYVRYPISKRPYYKDGWVRKNVFEGQTTGDNTGESSVNNITKPLDNMQLTGPKMSFGTFNSNRSGDRKYHCGVDVWSGDNNNWNVKALAAGHVAYCHKTPTGANGRYIVIKHDNIGGRSCYSFYAHLSSVAVNIGDSVTSGQQIGIAGGSGDGREDRYGRHLHFAIADKMQGNGSYLGYVSKFSGNSVSYGGITFYNPWYVIENGRLP